MRAAAFLLLTALTISVLTLAACGKKGPPDPPGPPSEVIWPKAYPTH
jgi:predicted small lipoprotein YifL